MRIARASVVGLAGLVGAAVLAVPAIGDDAVPPRDEIYLKRQEADVELVTTDDEDDDDTVDRGQQRDTHSRLGNQSRDVQSRDVQSRVDDTRDNTRDDSRDNTRDDSRDDRSRDHSRDDRSRDA